MTDVRNRICTACTNTFITTEEATTCPKCERDDLRTKLAECEKSRNKAWSEKCHADDRGKVWEERAQEAHRRQEFYAARLAEVERERDAKEAERLRLSLAYDELIGRNVELGDRLDESEGECLRLRREFDAATAAEKAEGEQRDEERAAGQDLRNRLSSVVGTARRLLALEAQMRVAEGDFFLDHEPSGTMRVASGACFRAGIALRVALDGDTNERDLCATVSPCNAMRAMREIADAKHDALVSALARTEKAEALLSRNEGRVKNIVDEALVRRQEAAEKRAEEAERELAEHLSTTDGVRQAVVRAQEDARELRKALNGLLECTLVHDVVTEDLLSRATALAAGPGKEGKR